MSEFEGIGKRLVEVIDESTKEIIEELQIGDTQPEIDEAMLRIQKIMLTHILKAVSTCVARELIP